jgi:hypothetical protein
MQRQGGESRPVSGGASLAGRTAALAALTLVACTTPQPIRPSPDPVTLESLVVMLDGVPWAFMDSLWQAGHFAGFNRPSRMISTFPSITAVAFRDIWHEPPTPGYEDRYYDRERSRLAGGLLDHVFGSEDAIMFHRLSTDTTVVAYIVATDALAHMSPREELVDYILEIETMLNEVRAAAGPGLEITMFSDHGNDRVPTERVDLEVALALAGFTVSSRVDDSGDVAIPLFGLVGSAFLYTTPESSVAVARAAAAVDGVDFVTWRDSVDGVHVLGGNGHAVIGVDGAAYRYRPVEPVLDRLRRDGLVDSLGFAPDSAWLAGTLDSPYIDPLRRIVNGLQDVENPADVIVSFSSGHHFGVAAADHLVGMRGTHGSLRTRPSLAFAMSSHRQIPDPVRTGALADWVELPLADGGLAGSGGTRSH